jgi:hypothetical protein
VPRSGTVTLSDVISPTLTLVCALCDRRGVLSVGRLMAKHGDAKLPDLRAFLSADCAKNQSADFTNRCQGLFGPTELRRERPTS